MFDTVNIWLGSEDIREKQFLSKLKAKLSDGKEIYCHKTRLTKYTGNLKNYRVLGNDFGISLRGSISKYVLGENTADFADQYDYKLGIEKISDALSLDISKGKIIRIDFGQNIKMNTEVINYYPILLSASYLTRMEYLNSLYFKNKRKVIAFYDKTTELRDRGFTVDSNNLMRYEMRLPSNPHLILKTEKLIVQSPLNTKVYSILLNRWFMEYNNIAKTPNTKPVLSFSNPKEMKNMLALMSLPNLEAEIIEHIERGQKDGTFDNMNAHRCKKELQEMKAGQAEFDKSLLDEMNSKMEAAYQNILNRPI